MQPESSLVDTSGNGGHITSCTGVDGRSYVVPWYGGYPTAAQLNGAAKPTATTCLPARATGVRHDSSGTVTFVERTGAQYRWVPTGTAWSNAPCR